ncbi:MAG TPA: hypothetical protein VFE32_17170 [Puia sp.]|jgi:hypothetical protein|nr:hypothetical protein [Puia sp.]
MNDNENMRDLKKELEVLRALGKEIVKRTSRLEEGLEPVQAPARPKRVNEVQAAIDRRNKHIRNKTL